MKKLVLTETVAIRNSSCLQKHSHHFRIADSIAAVEAAAAEEAAAAAAADTLATDSVAAETAE